MLGWRGRRTIYSCADQPRRPSSYAWVAVGILIEYAGVASANTLAVLRAHAFSHDMTLDDTADHVTNRPVLTLRPPRQATRA